MLVADPTKALEIFSSSDLITLRLPPYDKNEEATNQVSYCLSAR